MKTEKLQELYQKMLFIRAFDQLSRQLKMKDIIYSGYHPYEGQEAVAVGFCGALEREDVLLSTHRPHGHALAKGSSPEAILSEMMGRVSGCSSGLGGGMQYIDVENNFYCGSIVGSNLPIAAGVALAIQHQQQKRVSMCLFGDGAANTGSFHESLNLAAIWKLPVIFVCENNQFAEAMPVAEFVSCEHLSMRSHAYGLEEIRVDGNDIEASRRLAEELIARTRSGAGPFLVEAVTYRLRGHYIGDPEKTYRKKEEVERMRQKDPLLLAKNKLLSQGVSQAELDSEAQQIEQRLQQLQEWALKQPFPTLEQAIQHVYIPLDKELETCQ